MAVHSIRTSWISLSENNLSLPWLSCWRLRKGSQRTALHFIILVTFPKCVFINIRGEKLRAPSRLNATHRCSGVHDVGATSSAPTGPHLTFTIFCLETLRCSVLSEVDGYFLIFCICDCFVWESESSSEKKKLTHLKWVCMCKSLGLIVVKLADSARCWKQGMPHLLKCWMLP